MKNSTWIWIISIAIPGVIALMYYGPKPDSNVDLGILPRIYASLNFLTVITYVTAILGGIHDGGRS